MTAKTRIAVVGAGLMGHGIAEEFAAAGHEVKVHDPSAEALASLRERVAKVLADLAARSDAAGIIATAPAAGTKESPIVAAAKKSAAASR